VGKRVAVSCNYLLPWLLKVHHKIYNSKVPIIKVNCFPLLSAEVFQMALECNNFDTIIGDVSF
jgi:hypothetical protein